MSSEIVINATLPEVRVALIEDGEITDLTSEYETSRTTVGNIYKGRVTRVLPGMQAAFVDIGLERAAFLYAGDVITSIDDPEYPEDDDDLEGGVSSRNYVYTDSDNESSGNEDQDDEGDSEFALEAAELLAEKKLESLTEGRDDDEDDDEDDEDDDDSDDDASDDEENDDANTEVVSFKDIKVDTNDESTQEKSADNKKDHSPRNKEKDSGRKFTARGRKGKSGRGQSKRDRGRGRGRQKSRSSRRPPDINELLKAGQEVVVQVAKDAIGTKGARLTCHLTLPGRNVVLMPTVNHVGISRKIESAAERRRLREIVDNLRPPGMGCIIRTMANEQSREQITNEMNHLISQWSKIKRKMDSTKAPTLLQEELNLVLKTTRDNFTSDIYRLVVDSPRIHSNVLEFLDLFAPQLKNRVVRYTGKDPIFDAYGINSELAKALKRRVWLKSGGYLIFDEAEALTVIDVNTGKFIGKKSLADTIFKTNLEAVKEIAYQLRLRNIGGIIILDLIDMENNSHKEKVYRALEQALRKDRAKTNILRISELGLIQMTRKRTSESLNAVLCAPCPYCYGTGYIKNFKTVCFDIFREIERVALEGGITAVNISAHPEVVDALFQQERDTLDRIEERFGLKTSVKSNASLHIEAFEVEGERLSIRPMPTV